MSMDIKNYKFKVGDEVITTSGKRGRIIEICECDDCKKRGFCEPVWMMNKATTEDFITNIDAELGFPTFYKIGEYWFRDFDRVSIRREIQYYEQKIDELSAQLRVMDDVESGQED